MAPAHISSRRTQENKAEKCPTASQPEGQPADAEVVASPQHKLKCLCRLSFPEHSHPCDTHCLTASKEHNSNPTFPSRAYKLHNTSFNNRQPRRKNKPAAASQATKCAASTGGAKTLALL